MPYASNISIAVLDDNVLESQAIETLSAIGLSYENIKQLTMCISISLVR